MPLTLRRVKGSQLTWDEVDANWTAGRTFDGTVLLADESELPGLILAIAGKPQPEPKRPAKRRNRPATRPLANPQEQEAIPVAKPRERTLEAVLEALRVQFTLAEDEVLLRSLAIAAARLAEMEEDDEMVLLLA